MLLEGSNGIHDDCELGLQTDPSYVQLSGHFDICEGFTVITICGLTSSLYAATRSTVNRNVNATVLTYSILSLIQGKEWISPGTF